MRDERLFGGTTINPCLAKTHLPGLRRTWRLLTGCLAALGLLLVFLSPAGAVDGALDPTFITGPGPYAGVQTIPEIRGQSGYPYGSTGVTGPSILPAPLRYLLGSECERRYLPNNNNSCIARLNNTGALDTNFLINSQINGEIRGAYIYPHNDPSARTRFSSGGNFNVSPSGGGNSLTLISPV